jgi:hypothetical protein
MEDRLNPTTSLTLRQDLLQLLQVKSYVPTPGSLSIILILVFSPDPHSGHLYPKNLPGQSLLSQLKLLPNNDLCSDNILLQYLQFISIKEI